MMDFNTKSCPRCGNHRFASWADLDEEEKLLIEKLPLNTELPLETRKDHLFCRRCWFEFAADSSNETEHRV